MKRDTYVDSDTVSTYKVETVSLSAVLLSASLASCITIHLRPCDHSAVTPLFLRNGKGVNTIVLTVVRLSAPATTATHSRVIRLREVLTNHPPSGSSIDPASVAV